jgi:hypothetical protein
MGEPAHVEEARDNNSSSGMFLWAAFGYLLWGTSPHSGMPLPGLQAENG